MVVNEDSQLDIFVGSTIGSFKHVKYYTDNTKNNKKCIENLVDVKSLQKGEGITCMEWGNKEQTEILIGKKNQQIQVYHTLQGNKCIYTADYAEGHVVGLGKVNNTLVSAVSSGTVRVWGDDANEDIFTGGKLDRMRVCSDDTLFATGGEENDLKVWRVGESQPTFSAKNLAHDWLQLRQPVWVTDLVFVPGEGGRVVAVCSRHGYVRLYDTRSQRRPVQNVTFDLAATCIAPSISTRLALVGFARGQLRQVELRLGRPDKGYKGGAGAVTGAGAGGGRVLSTSLDRHLYVHRYSDKELVHKQYLTSKPSCILVQTETETPLRKAKSEREVDDVTEPADDMDAIFETMETVGDPGPVSKRPKPSLEGSTEVVEDTEAAIAKLLRSTEKTRKRREQRKREKKKKSVFHNA
ncbi:WD repeat-containing protein 74 [Bombyx mori]|uniref:WD repeat-containing protein 74 n=1 Tax=Bombyx mori TaxID=7091 RepID=A0A8R2M8G9_BOMMO|nr:WD repeat-containing protein 74 [Bombyx mori]